MGSGAEPQPGGSGGVEPPPAKTNYNCFSIFQNCIIHNFGRILNSLAILFIYSFDFHVTGSRASEPVDDNEDEPVKVSYCTS